MYSSFSLRNKLSVPKNESYGYVIPTMVKTAEDIAAKREDLVLQDTFSHDFHMDAPTRISFRFGQKRNSYHMLPFSRQQLCRKIGLPPIYFEKLLRSPSTELNALACTNVNALLKEHSGDMMLRTVGDCLRGVLSPQYSAFDSDEILDVFTSCVGPDKALNPEDMAIRGYVSSMDVLHLRFTTHKPVTTKTDRDIYYGLEITSSDVGMYSLSVRFFVYKRICSNGLCVSKFDNELYTHPHKGINKDMFYEGLKRSFTSFPFLVAKATECINKAGAYSLHDSPLFNLKANTPESTRYLENMERYLGIGQDNMSIIADIASENYGTSLWGYVNAITEWAQKYDFVRRKELEVKAGRLITDFDSIMAG